MLRYNDVKKEAGGVFVKEELVSDEEMEGLEEGEAAEMNYDEGETLEDYEKGMLTDPMKTRYRKMKVRHCAYCFELTHPSDMVCAPFSASRRQQWIDILGDGFKDYVEKYKTPHICKKHFDPVAFTKSMTAKNGGRRSYAKKPLPIAEAIYEGRKLQDYQYRQPPPEIKKSVRCSYCHVKADRKDMKTVPKGNDKRDLWYRRLGDEFKKNVYGKLRSYICRSHFPQALTFENGEVSNFALPVPMGESDEPVTSMPITTHMGCLCAYCGAHDLIGKMVPVPEGEDRDSWCYILGEKFAINLTKLEHLYICSSHFEEEMPTKQSLPVADKTEQIKEPYAKRDRNSLVTCTYCSAKIPISHRIIAEINDSRLEEWCDILGEDFEYNSFKTDMVQMCKTHFTRFDFVPLRYRLLKDTAKPIPIKLTQRKMDVDMPMTKQCLYCNKTDRYCKMRRIHFNSFNWRLWTEVFGPEFDKKYWKERDTLPAVCRVHLNEEGTPLKFSVLRAVMEPECSASSTSSIRSTIKTEVKTDGENNFKSRNNNRQDLNLTREELRNFYSFGWVSSEAMQLRQEMAVKAEIMRENLEKQRRKTVRCVYCLFPIHAKSKCYGFVDEQIHIWQHYGTVFGKQYLARLQNTEPERLESDSDITTPQESPELMLCLRHIDPCMRPIPDPKCFYATDELLDHTYANFS